MATVATVGKVPRFDSSQRLYDVSTVLNDMWNRADLRLFALEEMFEVVVKDEVALRYVQRLVTLSLAARGWGALHGPDCDPAVVELIVLGDLTERYWAELFRENCSAKDRIRDDKFVPWEAHNPYFGRQPIDLVEETRCLLHGVQAILVGLCAEPEPEDEVVPDWTNERDGVRQVLSLLMDLHRHLCKSGNGWYMPN
jgi:hypothetical protein